MTSWIFFSSQANNPLNDFKCDCYVIKDFLGKGTFGNAYMVYDMNKEKKCVFSDLFKKKQQSKTNC